MMTESGKHIGLHACAFGLAIGIASAIGMLLFGLSAYYYSTGHQLIALMGSVYVGYAPTIKGSFIGALWGLVEGFIWGLIIAWLYNFFSRCCGKWCCPKACCPTTQDKTPPKA